MFDKVTRILTDWHNLNPNENSWTISLHQDAAIVNIVANSPSGWKENYLTLTSAEIDDASEDSIAQKVKELTNSL